MPDYSVESDGTEARFLSGGQPVASLALDQVRALYDVTAGSDMQANNSTFWIIELADKLVIVPEDTIGMLALLERWKAPLAQRQAAFRAVCHLPPKDWRRTRWGIFPHHETKLCVTAPVDYGAVMPEWKILGPLGPDSQAAPAP